MIEMGAADAEMKVKWGGRNEEKRRTGGSEDEENAARVLWDPHTLHAHDPLDCLLYHSFLLFWSW